MPDIDDLHKMITAEVTDNAFVTILNPLDDATLADIGGFYHSSNGNHITDIIRRGKFISSDQRLKVGLSNWREGMSVMDDLKGGGSNGVFTRMYRRAEDITNDGSAVTFVFNKSIANRTDWYAFPSDQFGRIKGIKTKFKGRRDFIGNGTFV